MRSTKVLIVLSILTVVFSISLLPIDGYADTPASSGFYPYINVTGTSRSSLHTEFIYSDSMVLVDAQGLSTDIAKASASLAGAGYSSGNVNSMLSQMGCYSISNYQFGSRSIDDNDHVAYTIGKKSIPGTDYKLLCVVVKGTSGDEEWFSNFNLGRNNGGDHEGFYKAAREVYAGMAVDFGSNTIIWITGHSRGAAVANLVAGWCTERFGGEHVFGYTFACPNVSKNVSSYSNIHNFNNSGDLIAAIPLSDWGYGRFGITHTWNYASDVQAMGSMFYNSVGGSYSGANNTVEYEAILKEIVPSESNYYDPLRYFGMMLVAYRMQNNGHTSWTQFLDKYLFGNIDDYLYDKIHSSSGLSSASSAVSGAENDLTEASNLLDQVIIDTKDLTEEEFSAYLQENASTISKITKITGMAITKFADLSGVAGFLASHIDTAISVGKIMGYVMALCEDSTGNIIDAIPYAHTPETYVLGINRRYFGYKAYSGQNVESIQMPNNITTLGYMCFENSMINDLTLSSSLKYIAKRAMYGCVELTELVLPDGLEQIDDWALYDCTGITTLTVPDSVQILGNGCLPLSLTDLTIPFIGSSRNANDTYDAVFNYVFGASLRGAGNGTGLDRRQPYNAEENAYYEYTTELSHVSITDATIIPDYAFYNSENTNCLTQIHLSENLSSIGTYAFYKCKVLSGEWVIPEGVSEINDYTFYGCTGITGMTLPSSLITIGQYAFYGCSKLSYVAYHGTADGWAKIMVGDHNDPITQLTIEYVFQFIEPDFVLPAHLRTIEEEAFSGIDARSILLPDTISSISNHAFSSCTNLKQIIIPSSEIEISDEAFDENAELVIFGVSGSATETFARQHHYVFYPLEQIPAD